MDVSSKWEERLKNWFEEPGNNLSDWVDDSTVERGNIARAHFTRDSLYFLSKLKEKVFSSWSICVY